MEYKATDLPGKSLYKIPFNLQIRSITPIEQKYSKRQIKNMLTLLKNQ